MIVARLDMDAGGRREAAAADRSALCRQVGRATETMLRAASRYAVKQSRIGVPGRHRSEAGTSVLRLGCCPPSGIELASGPMVEGKAMVPTVTLLDLVNAVAKHARSEAEVIATIVCMVNQGHVRLCGTLKVACFD